MTTQDQKDQKTQEVKIPAHYHVTVANIVDGAAATDIFSRDFPFDKKDSAMKGVRQRIRDLGDDVSIRNAKVTFEDKDGPNGLTRYQTITFTDLVITEKPKTPTKKGQSNARKNAVDNNPTEMDQEILGIALDADVPEEDASKALMKYQRHFLIHAANLNVEEEDRLSHFSTKLTAVEHLLAKATVETE